MKNEKFKKYSDLAVKVGVNRKRTRFCDQFSVECVGYEVIGGPLWGPGASLCHGEMERRSDQKKHISLCERRSDCEVPDYVVEPI